MPSPAQSAANAVGKGTAAQAGETGFLEIVSSGEPHLDAAPNRLWEVV